VINEKNFLQTALHCYDNPQCVTLEEFQDDLNRFSHIKKQITRYVEGQADLNDRLLLNHLVVLFNVFGDTALDLLLFKIDEKNYGTLFPFLILLNRLPDEAFSKYDTIQLDQTIIQRLRQI
jgi:hypothetical protein